VSEERGESAGLPAELVDWIRSATGAAELRVERRTGGASREGYAVDVRGADGAERALWLRVDSGAGPQSHTLYSLRREAAVYRALGATPLRVARLVAVHPRLEVFLLERIEGRGWFAEIREPAQQIAVATDFMAQIALLHRIDPRSLDLPELGEPTRVSDHVRAEIDEWEAQYREHDVAEPLFTLAIAWLRARLPADGDWPVVLVQGDTGPGNFMYRGDRVAAITDWELAHWGDLHDDLGWICVRDAQERFTHLPDRLRDYERLGGRRIDPARLRYFRVLAQARCAIGTRRGLLARDHRAEMAAHLIFNSLHMRLLAEALAGAEGLELPKSEPLEPGETDASWAFDVALDDLRLHVVPALGEGFAARRAKGLARLLKYLRELERLGPSARQAERRELSDLLGRDVADLREGRAALCAAIESGAVDVHGALGFCLASVARSTQIARPAMGALADRHHAPIDG
jgi:aminoglycoside phosphotransferase (APT) family kinase protein